MKTLSFCLVLLSLVAARSAAGCPQSELPSTVQIAADGQAIPASSSILPPEASPVDPGEHAYEAFVRAAWSFQIERAGVHADRLMHAGTPEQQFIGFFLVLRSAAWLDALFADGARLDAALEVLDRAMATRLRVAISEEYAAQDLDRHVAMLDEAIANAVVAVQRARSNLARPAVDRAFVKLRASRPWYWFNDRAGEIEAASSMVGVLRDRFLVDLFTESRMNAFVDELTSGDRLDLAVAAGILDAKGAWRLETRGDSRRHGELLGHDETTGATGPRLIPTRMRLYDASNASVLEPIGPKAAGVSIARFLES